MLVNKNCANIEVATVYGLIKFNDNGESKDLNAEQEQALAKIPGYEYVEDKTAKEEAPKAEAPKKAPAKKKAAPKTKTEEK